MGIIANYTAYPADYIELMPLSTTATAKTTPNLPNTAWKKTACCCTLP